MSISKSYVNNSCDDYAVIDSFSKYFYEHSNNNRPNFIYSNKGNLDKVQEDILDYVLQSYHATQCESDPRLGGDDQYIRREYEALKALYDSTNGSNWRTSIDVSHLNATVYPGRTWNFVTSNGTDYNDPCAEKWIGVTCTRDVVNGNCTVSMLILYDINLHGYLPTKIGYLTSLELMLIQNNYLSRSTIPTEIGQLSRLTFLGLKSNNLNGQIPTQIGQLTALRLLVLSYNDFTNNLPTEIGKLTLLRTLNVKKNRRLNGRIPQEFKSLTQLKDFVLRSCNMSGNLSALVSMTKLQWLEVQENRFTGHIPQGLTNLSVLVNFTITRNLRYFVIKYFTHYFVYIEVECGCLRPQFSNWFTTA